MAKTPKDWNQWCYLPRVFLEEFFEGSCSPSLSSLLLSLRSSSSILKQMEGEKTQSKPHKDFSEITGPWDLKKDKKDGRRISHVGWSSQALGWWLLELLEELPRSERDTNTNCNLDLILFLCKYLLLYTLDCIDCCSSPCVDFREKKSCFRYADKQLN